MSDAAVTETLPEAEQQPPRKIKVNKDAKAPVAAAADDAATDEAGPAPAPTPAPVAAPNRLGTHNGPGAAQARREPESPLVREQRGRDEQSLKELLDGFGAEASMRIRITRKKPTEIRVKGKTLQVGGFLETTEERIDETWLQNKYGGGTYELNVNIINSKTGRWEYALGGHKIVTIAGEPNPEYLPKAQTDEPAVASTAHLQQGADPIAMKMMEHLTASAKTAEQRAYEAMKGNQGGDSAVVDILRDELKASRAELGEMRKRMDDLMVQRATPPPQSANDKASDMLLHKLIEGDSARIAAIQAQHQSEVNQLRQSALDLERRLRDEADRDKAAMRSQHDREIAMLQQTHNLTIKTMESSHAIALASVKDSASTNKTITDSESRRQERELAELKEELKELRAKKDKSPIEMAKDFQAIKEAFGGDEEGGSTSSKLVDMIPDVIGAVAARFAQAPPAPPAEVPTAVARRAGPAARARAAGRRVVRDQSGQKFVQEEDGTVTPVGENPGEPPAPARPAMPQVDPESVRNVANILEGAFQRGADPEDPAFLQSARSLAPPDLLRAISEHGVDRVVEQMAQLPSSSPLRTISGKTWLRKFGKALVGE